MVRSMHTQGATNSTLFATVVGQAFVYREAKSTRLGEMRERLEEVFQKRLGGEGKLQVMTDAKDIDRTRLDPAQSYMQITYCPSLHGIRVSPGQVGGASV